MGRIGRDDEDLATSLCLDRACCGARRLADTTFAAEEEKSRPELEGQRSL
jgi:hypothetical protein